MVYGVKGRGKGESQQGGEATAAQNEKLSVDTSTVSLPGLFDCSLAFSCSGFRLSGVWCAPESIHPTPYTIHRTPYTLQPSPHTLHPTPFRV